MSLSDRRSRYLFGVLCVGAAAAIALVVSTTGTRPSGEDTHAANTALVGQSAAGDGQSRQVYFRNGNIGPDHGKIVHIEQGISSAPSPVVEPLACEVVHASGGVGICLAAERGVVTTYSAKIFSLTDHKVRTELALAGVPSRARVAASGRYAATTVFVSGHGYDAVDFSTQTLLLDLSNDTVLADLESFTFIENGEPFTNADFNVWGVTFAPDGNTFFATLSTQRRHLLVRGDIAGRSATVLRDNVECPSVSPDGTRLAYKKRFTRDGRIGWELQVLDLRTMADIPLAEERSVDDQLEWLDHGQVLYSVAAADGAGSDVWRTNADGTGSPAVFLRAAYSPAVVRSVQ